MREQGPPPGAVRPRPWQRLRAGTRVALLAVAALIPVFALLFFFVYQIRQTQFAEIRAHASDLGDGEALTAAALVDTAQSTVLALADTPSLKGQDAAAATAALQAVLANHPSFLNLWAANSGGTVYASALPLPAGAPTSIAGESYFQKVLSTGMPVVQTVRGFPGRPGVFAALTAVPVLVGGMVNGTVQVAFLLAGLQSTAAFIGLPAGSVVTVVDGQANIVERSLQPERSRGVNITGTALWTGLQSGTQGVFQAPDLDGVVRLNGFQSVPGTDWKAVVGQPSPAVFAPVTDTTAIALGLLAVTALIAGVLTWRGKQLADLTEAERRRLEGVIDQLPEGVFVAAADGRVLVANHALAALLGTPIQAGRDYREQIEPAVTWLRAGAPLPWEALPPERARRGEAVQGEQIVAQRSDGSRRDLLINARPLVGAGGEVEEILVVAADITALKDLDRAKDEFISIAAHELRNPLAGLKGYAELLLRQGREEGLSPELLQRLAAVDELADRLAALTNRLLDLSRLETGRFELVRQPTDLVALAREVLEALQMTTTAHRLTLEASPGRIVGDWDPAALRQVFNNLVGNAIKYAAGGEIAIRLYQEDGQADAFISDQGPGIPPDQIPHLFERFRQAGATPAQRAGGLGLGLYLSRRITEAHGGRIGLQSQVGRGSTFWLTLPLRAGQVAREPDPALLARVVAERLGGGPG